MRRSERFTIDISKNPPPEGGTKQNVMKIVQLKDKDYDEDVMLIAIPDGLENYTNLINSLHIEAVNEAEEYNDSWLDILEDKLEPHGIVRVYIDDTVYI